MNRCTLPLIRYSYRMHLQSTTRRDELKVFALRLQDCLQSSRPFSGTKCRLHAIESMTIWTSEVLTWSREIWIKIPQIVRTYWEFLFEDFHLKVFFLKSSKRELWKLKTMNVLSRKCMEFHWRFIQVWESQTNRKTSKGKKQYQAETFRI